jgi:hypothetical protein
MLEVLEIKSLLDQIKLGSIKEKIVISLVNDIENHDNLDDEVTVRSLDYLSYWLFVIGEEDIALCTAEVVNQITNLENGVIRICKYDCLVLSSYIYMRKKNEQQSNDYWNKLLDLNFGDNVKENLKRINKKIWNRKITTGDVFEIDDKQKQAAEKNNHIRGVVYWSFRSLESLFWMSKMGGSEKYPLEKISQLINERIFFLKENIDSADARDFTGNK